MSLFGTSGIRGIANKEVTPELAQTLGHVLASHGKLLLLARDTRTTGKMLADALTSGALASGADIIDLGIAPTPVLAYATRAYRTLGVMVTASHNPPEYNGLKLFSHGREFQRAQENEVSDRIEKKEFSLAPWNAVGKYQSSPHLFREYSQQIISHVNFPLIREKAPKVLLDPGNAAGSILSPHVLREAGCKVLSVNSEPSGFFNRGLEPNEENLRTTCALVRSSGASLGIAHDGDADRAVIIDEKGELLGLDAQLALMCEKMLEKQRGAIVTTVEASLSVRETIEKHKANLSITPVGSVYVAEEVAKRDAIFGGEPCGEYIFPPHLLVPDGLLTALKFVELFCEKGSLHKLKKKIHTYPMKRAKFPTEKKHEAMQHIIRELAVPGTRSLADGIRIDGKDYWLLIRASGTEPVVRLTCEAKNAKRLNEIAVLAEKIIRKNI